MIPVILVVKSRMWAEVHRRASARNVHAVFGGMKRHADFVLTVNCLNKQAVLCVLHKVKSFVLPNVALNYSLPESKCKLKTVAAKARRVRKQPT